MRKITSALMFSVYLFTALTVAGFMWRGGAGWGAGTAALAGVLGLGFAIHALVTQGSVRDALEGEIETVREAHRLLADALDAINRQTAEISARLEKTDHDRSGQLTSEVRMLETLVQRMGEDIGARIAGLQQRQGVMQDSAAPPEARRSRQAAALIETVRGALAENRVDLYLQPVVSLPQRRTVFYESFSRLRDETGRVLMPAEYLSVAEPAGLISTIDNLLLFRCVQIVRRLAKQDRRVGIFCNISMASLGDDLFFPQFLEFLADNKDLSGSLIFEVGQAAFEDRGSVEARNMAKLGDLGFRFSIDKVQSLEIDFQDLQRSDVKFLKVGAEVLLEQLLEIEGRPALKTMSDIHAADFAAITRRWGVEVIAEKIENERQVVDVLDLEIGYGQGHLFGEPRAIREQVLAETDPPAEFMRSSMRLKRQRGQWG
jgi:cyclic-di-GMP phosphodiesterase TipF (flagellum assembly factor)